MNDSPERTLAFESCFNFRDLGGYTGLDDKRVRWRRIFRSSTPQHMNQADAEAVAALDIGLVIDFRGERFPHSGPVPAPGGTRLPLSPPSRSDDPDYERYRALMPHEALPEVLERYAEQFASALTAMAERPQTNVLFHCRLGKDRTGVFAALLLKLLGVSDAGVVEDYMLTTEDEAPCREHLTAAEPEESNRSREPLVASSPASRAAIEAVIDRIDSTYGGAYAYFARHGVTAGVLDAFIEAALEPLSEHPRQPHASGEPVPG